MISFNDAQELMGYAYWTIIGHFIISHSFLLELNHRLDKGNKERWKDKVKSSPSNSNDILVYKSMQGCNEKLCVTMGENKISVYLSH